MDQRGRAAASIAQPLGAEVLVDGVWLPGAVLGWRHDESGGCAARVAVELPGGRQELQVALDEVRLPEGPAVPAFAPESPAPTVVMSRVQLRELLSAGRAGRAVARPRRHASDLTAELPVVHCTEIVAGAGRHRAPAGSGRHRAGEDLAAVSGSALRTRPIRLDDVAAWSWSGTAAVVR